MRASRRLARGLAAPAAEADPLSNPCQNNGPRQIVSNHLCDQNSGFLDPVTLEKIPVGQGYCTGKSCIGGDTIKQMYNKSSSNPKVYRDPHSYEVFQTADLQHHNIGRLASGRLV